jgi:hypothetical protein
MYINMFNEVNQMPGCSTMLHPRRTPLGYSPFTAIPAVQDYFL